MKKSTLIKLHLYCGLFTSFYLIAFGVSSIVLNHKMDLDNKDVKKTWQDQLQVNASLSDKEIAEKAAYELGIMGWVAGWNLTREADDLKFQVLSLAKTSNLDLNLRTGEIKVSEIPKGFWATLHSMHFFTGRIPNGPLFFKTWIVYQWLTLLVLFFSLVLGLWLWLKYSYKSWELFVFGGLFLISILIMALL